MKNKFLPAALCFAILAFISCSKSAIKSTKPASTTGSVLSLTPLEQQKARGDNGFSLQLFNAVAADDNSGKNLFISPLSVSIAMAMTSNGAEGQTLTAIDNAMSFNGYTQAQLNSYYNKLITDLPKLDPNTTLNIANSIWYRQGFSVLPEFISTDSSYYKAQVQSLDFSLPSSPQTINNWVNTATSGKITQIISGSIPSDLMMYLINALYFKSTWKESFDASQTKALPFYLAAGAPVQTSFMSGNIDINSYYDSKVTVFEMPYSGSKYSMVIVVPQTTVTLPALRAEIDSAQWQTWMSSLKPTKQQITLPKFQFSYAATLNDELTALGMGIAFTNSADFSKISPQPLQISQVEHKAYISVDESGTEAAAVTSVGVTATVAPEYSPTYNVNRPFIFAIREMNSGLILFTGIVNNPTLSGE
jgi:serpin B